MELEEAIRSRRTHKAFDPAPVPRPVLDELFDLARWAPNHHLTNPWRFRVLGPEALRRLRDAADAAEPGSGAKLDRAPTLVAVTATQTGEPIADAENRLATAVAAYVILLAAHGRGLAGYWRTPAVLRTRPGRAAVEIGDEEEVIGLLYLGTPRQEQRAPERAPVSAVVRYLI